MSPENGSDIQQKVEYVKKSLPKEMANAASKFSPEEFLRRAELYQELLKSEGWDGNDMNFHVTGRDTITRGELLARYTRNSK